jgi:hypothetical protein
MEAGISFTMKDARLGISILGRIALNRAVHADGKIK